MSYLYNTCIRAVSMKVMITLIAVACSMSVQAQENTGSEKETLPPWIYDFANSVTPYGSIRIGAGFAEKGEIGIANNAPRVGFRFKHLINKEGSKKFSIIGRVEFGLNLVARDETVSFAVDPGPGITQVGDAVFARLGFVGLEYDAFRLTFGKQNSVYYNLGASEADRSLAFGGAALGVWNISDGGVSGTGRANQAIQLAYEKNGLSLGVQIQARNISDTSEGIDTYGFGARYKVGAFGIGIGYNKANDGVLIPLPNQAKDGDEAFISSVSYEKNRLLIALAYSSLTQHQKVTLVNGGTFFYDANGIEFYLRYKFSADEKWHGAVGYSYLNPESDQGLQDFDTKFSFIELAYNFRKSSHIFISSQLNGSRNFTGGRRAQSVYGLGIRYGF